MIALLDPSLRNNNAEHSKNLGDVIIRESVTAALTDMFPKQEIKRISTHTFPSQKEYQTIEASDFLFIGGSNLLSSHIMWYNQWKLASPASFYFLFPKVKNAILLGVGWWQYQSKPDFVTSHFYKKVLHPDFSHSVRDGYTKQQLAHTGIKQIINTTCPTLWNLDGIAADRTDFLSTEAVFTLTDYNKTPDSDGQLIETLLQHFEKLHFFAQGAQDEKYINSLAVFQANKNRIKVFSSLEEYHDCLQEGNKVYVGTRLHGGVKAMKMGLNALIIAIDNRATEIGKDIQLPVVQRGDITALQTWLNGKSNIGRISINHSAIKAWKSQFR